MRIFIYFLKNLVGSCNDCSSPRQVPARILEGPSGSCKDPSQYCKKDHSFKVFSVNKVLARSRE